MKSVSSFTVVISNNEDGLTFDCTHTSTVVFFSRYWSLVLIKE